MTERPTSQGRKENRLPPAQHGAGTISLAPGGQLLYLDVVHEPAPRLRPTAVARLGRRLDRLLSEEEVSAGVIFEGTKARNTAVLAALTNSAALSNDVERTYRTEIVDHIDDRDTSTVDDAEGLFHFINVFSVAPGRSEHMIEYFTHTIPAVRVQPGYVSTNLIVNTSGTRAVNIGQYRTRKEFIAIFRQKSVLRAFSAGPSYKVMRRALGVLPAIPRLRLYGEPVVTRGTSDAP
ncbi:hypothetical protein [Amycolatopsis sp. NPDC051371]|uniref:hypothetical protein n=1 Tax=Amycolatopsis sp. NPDC051371 TaxID=3155800 RepID=UPI003431E574